MVRMDDVEWVSRCPDCGRYRYFEEYPMKTELECVSCQRAMGVTKV